MENKVSKPVFNSRFSFRPLLRVWKEKTREGREGKKQFYSELLEKVKQYPELMQPIEDDSVFDKHKSLIDQMMSTIFPVTLSEQDDLYAVSLPFTYKVYYASELFRMMFLNENNIIQIPLETEQKISDEKLAGAYQLILNRLYNMEVGGVATSVHPYQCPISGLDKFMELEMDTRFIDVNYVGNLPIMPSTCDCKGCNRVSDILKVPGLQESIPLEQFQFEGMVIIRIREVTEREVINNIKTRLLDIHSFSDAAIFKSLQEQIQNLLCVAGVQTALKPFLTINNNLVLSEFYTTITMEKEHMPSEEKQYEMYKSVKESCPAGGKILLMSEINEEAVSRYPFLAKIYQMGWKSAIMCPLYTQENQLVGVLLVVSKVAFALTNEHLVKIEPVVPLFTLALQKSQEHLDHQVDKVIKEQFTAVQDAVEWRFTKAALNYLTRKNKGEQSKIEHISFEKVFPLYGAVDIRNSAVERNNAIQLDLLEQLSFAAEIVNKAKVVAPFPLLDEVLYRINKYSHAVSNILFAEEEQAIHYFLSEELVQLFRHFEETLPELRDEIARYIHVLDSPVKMLYNHRKAYEESITYINSAVAKFLDTEQVAAQQMFPHYFERFVTDGVDFNIYIGQSISPQVGFDEFYLKNLKIWQLSTLAKAAQLTHRLEKELSLPLQTTQLILAHSHPISISFRTAERKFDVDGAYNIRYEIIKKRIDKVHLRDSNERLTQPGTIAIVYSQPKEAQEYISYIEYLQSTGLLKAEIEKYDLEELQGVSGLKGLRAIVNLDEETKEAKKPGKQQKDVKLQNTEN